MILSAAILFLFRHRALSHGAVSVAAEMRQQQDSSDFDTVTETPYVVHAPPPANLRYPEEYNEVGGRVKGKLVLGEGFFRSIIWFGLSFFYS